MGDVISEWAETYPWAVRVRRFDDGGLLPELREAYIQAQGLHKGRLVSNWNSLRSVWCSGPWMTEPDLIEWRWDAVPYPLLMVRGSFGALCGYVGLPPSHPLHGKDHGAPGLTEDINWGLPSGNGPVFVTPKGHPWCWWLGFDGGEKQFLPALPGIPSEAAPYLDVAELRKRVERLALSLQSVAPEVPPAWAKGGAPLDSAFRAELARHDPDWAMRAVSGYTVRRCCHDPVASDQANRHGLARAHTEDERAAWTFGFTWIDRSN